jgi:multidrug resistance protein, MATE family
VALFYVASPDVLLVAHGAKADPAEFEALRSWTVVLLRFVAFYCLFDSMVVVFSSAIKGAGDTRFVLITTLCMSPLPVLATLLGIEVFGLGLYWSWTAITSWLCALGIIYIIRFRQGRWRTMRVIEHAADEPDRPTAEDSLAAAIGGEAA